MFVLSGVALLCIPSLVTQSPPRVICSPGKLKLGLQMALVGLPVTKSGCKGVQSPQNKHCYIVNKCFFFISCYPFQIFCIPKCIISPLEHLPSLLTQFGFKNLAFASSVEMLALYSELKVLCQCSLHMQADVISALEHAMYFHKSNVLVNVDFQPIIRVEENIFISPCGKKGFLDSAPQQHLTRA